MVLMDNSSKSGVCPILATCIRVITTLVSQDSCQLESPQFGCRPGQESTQLIDVRLTDDTLLVTVTQKYDKKWSVNHPSMEATSMILAGDVGGTKTHLALFSVGGETLRPLAEETYKSKSYSGLEEVVEGFLRDKEKEVSRESIRAACFGIAGPVVEDRSQTPNLPWVVDAQTLKETIAVEKVQLINDLEANGYGIPLLAADELEPFTAVRSILRGIAESLM